VRLRRKWLRFPLFRTERKRMGQSDPGLRKTSKHRGDMSEVQFMIETPNRGFGVAKPIGDNELYDVILDRGRRRFWRAQVRDANACIKTDSR
jgi:hypothetical protein